MVEVGETVEVDDDFVIGWMIDEASEGADVGVLLTANERQNILTNS